jgi:hypothetical protein
MRDGLYNHYEQDAGACCGFVVSADACYGAARFCDAPAVPGSSYCARHRALCQVPPGSRAGKRIRADQARAANQGVPPPPRLAALPVPEPLEAADDSDDTRAYARSVIPRGEEE